MKKNVLLLLIFFAFAITGFSQNSSFGKIPLTKIKETQQKSNAQSILYSNIKPVSGTTFRLVKTTTDKKGGVHSTYQQYYNDIKVAFGVLKVHSKNGLQKSYNGAYFNTSGLRTSPGVSKSQVLSSAKNYMGSANIFWPSATSLTTTKEPTPELRILPNRKTEELNLAYTVVIGVSEPETKMGTVYVDAASGKVIKFKSHIQACFEDSHEGHNHSKTATKISLATGSGETAYSGTQNIVTKLDGDYVLNDETRSTGSSWGLSTQGLGTKTGIITVDMQTSTNVGGTMYEFTDSNNSWTATEMSSNENQYALDAHWGSQVVYDYWKNVRGRNGYNGSDSALLSLVHYGNDYLNAAWAGISETSGYMFYGDGSGSYTPLTTLDVVSHEIAHGINNATSNLDYEFESGALNEGLSDVWAMVIDNYSNTTYGTTKDYSEINDENGGGSFRSMSNPNLHNQPDTYGGTFWVSQSGCVPDGDTTSPGYNDYCGVHTNSGVLNHWFWLLSQGGSGTNDIGDTFSVTAIGMDDAAAIVWQMQENYLTSTSDFAAARTAAIQAAQDLFGTDCSSQEEAVTNAWYSVGVGAAFDFSNIPVVTTDPIDITVCEGETVMFSAAATGHTAQGWRRNTGSSWGNISDGSVFSGVSTDDLTITDVTYDMDGHQFRLSYVNDCGSVVTNTATLTVYDQPIGTVAVTEASCGVSDGELTFTFPDHSWRTNLEFSIDGGSTYPYDYDDTLGSQTATGLAAATYNVWVRWGNEACPVEIGDYVVGSTSTATTGGTIPASTGQSDGILTVNFPDVTGQTAIKFSVDGGSTYPYSFDDTLGAAEITGLAAATYNVWVALGDDSCMIELGDVIMSEIDYTSIPDANFEAALDALTYDNYLGDNKVPTANINTVTNLNVDSQSISDLTGIEAFVDLTSLSFQSNSVSTIDLSNLTDLTHLYFQYNHITAIDLSNNTLLEHIASRDNGLSDMNLTHNTALVQIYSQNNNFTGALDLSNHPNLTLVAYANSDLSTVNIQNGTNIANGTTINFNGNDNLTCILVDDVAHSTTNWTNIETGTTFSATTCVDYTNGYTAIPDVNFEAELGLLSLDDIASDGYVPTANIETLTDLYVNSSDIADLTGIEDFTALEHLGVWNNDLTTVNLSSNTALISLTINNNDLTSLDVSANTVLGYLYCNSNQLTSLAINNNTGATLVELYVGENPNLTALSVTNNTLLKKLDLSGCQIATLDLSTNSVLEELDMQNNNFSLIDLTNNLTLIDFDCNANSIASLDLSLHTVLTDLDCSNNSLTFLDVKNGNYLNVNTFKADFNSSLNCIIVDDVAHANTNWTKDSGASFSGAENCEYTQIPDANFEAELAAYDDIANDGQVPTANIEVITVLDLSGKSISSLTGIEDFRDLEALDCSGNTLTTVDFSNNLYLDILDCDSNNLTSLDVSANINLRHLSSSNQSISSIDLTTNVLLENIDFSSTDITDLNMVTNTVLREVFLGDMPNLQHVNLKNGNNGGVNQFYADNSNNLTCVLVSDLNEVDSGWTGPTTVVYSDTDYCDYTYVPDDNFEAELRDLGLDDSVANDDYVPTELIEVITELDLTDGFLSGLGISDLTGIEDFRDLVTLDAYSNNMSIVDVSNNLALQSIDVSSCSNLTTIIFGNNTVLKNVDAGNCNNLTALDVSNNTALSSLDISSSLFTSNQITAIDLSYNTALRTLNVASCENLTNLDISNNTSLRTLEMTRTELTSIDITNNTELRNFLAFGSPITNVDFSNNTELKQVSVNICSLTSIDLSNNPNIEELKCQNQKDENGNFVLTEIIINNGNDTNVDTFTASLNDNLSCILVDDLTNNDYSSWSISSATLIDAGYCRYTQIPDANFETTLRDDYGLDDSAVNDGQVPTALIEVVTSLNVDNKGISDLTGIEDFRDLITLNCKYNSLTTVNTSANIGLEAFYCDFNYTISSLDLSTNAVLNDFTCSNNALTNLDLSSNAALVKLYCEQNGLTTLNVSNNILLEEFYCDDNAITDIDVSLNTVLNDISVTNNNLSNLNVKNGNNTNFVYFDSTGNTGLSCIEVDDDTASYLTTLPWNKDTTASFNSTACTSYTLIPDANFEAELEAQGYDDISGDGKVPTNAINGITSLDVRNKNIADLTGIQDFVALTYLHCGDNALTIIDVSANVLLETLYVNENQLSSIDVSSNTALTILGISTNNVTAIDVSANTSLTTLDVSDNSLTTLDVSVNTALEYLYVDQNNLTSLNVADLLSLKILTISDNAITAIDVSSNTLLENFTAENCVLTSFDANGLVNLEQVAINSNPNFTTIDLNGATNLRTLVIRSGDLQAIDVSTNVNLEWILIDDNALTSFDMTNNPLVTFLLIGTNNLTSVDLRNGNIEGITTFQSVNNANLTCISVSNVTYAIDNFTSIDNHTSFSQECGVYTYVPDDNFEAALGVLTLDDVANDDHVPTANIVGLSTLDVSGESIVDLTGIEAFAALTTLDVNANNITNVDFSNNTLLSTLDISNNALVFFDVSANTALTAIDVSTNELRYLNIKNGTNTNITTTANFDATGNPALKCILVDSETYATSTWTNIDGQTAFNETDCTVYTQIPDANFEDELSAYDDIPNDGQVPTINIYFIEEISLSASNIADLTGIEDFVHLEVLDVGNNDVTSLDFSNNVYLADLDVDDNALLTSLNITGNQLLTHLSAKDNVLLTTLNLSGNTALINVDLQGSQLTTIDFTNNATIEILDLEDNALTSITNISALVNLKELDIENNQLTNTIDLSSNVLLEEADLDENGFTTLDFTNNVNLTYLDIQKNDLASVTFGDNLSVLDELDASQNFLTTMDTSQLPLLDDLDLEDNLLEALNLNSNTALEKVDVKNNALTDLDIKNGTNALNISYFDATGNPGLTCIRVDDVTYSTSNWTNIDTTASFNDEYCRYTYVPDDNFETALRTFGYDDSITNDDFVPTVLIEIIEYLTVSGEGISDLTGIEDFIALKTLNCSTNSLTSLDVTYNIKLERLYLNNNSISLLDVTQNVLLERLQFHFNNIVSIDVTKNLELQSISAYDNLLTSIDITQNTQLEWAYFNNNPIGNIDFKNNIMLDYLECINTAMTTLDLSNNTLLEEVYATDNANLTNINIQNGTNATNISDFEITNNPSLLCVLVDSVTYSTANWTEVDNAAVYNEVSCTIDYELSAKVFLQGAALNPNTGEESLMRDDLRVEGGIYGATSPYGDGAMISESVGLNDEGVNSMVDWIWVELRDATDPTIVIAGQSGVLQRDGDIVAIDGSSPLTFSLTSSNYYVVIKHRNHLSIMSSTAITFDGSNTTILDFTNANNQITYGTNAQATYGLPTGKVGMWAGDANNDGKVGYNNAVTDINTIQIDILLHPNNTTFNPAYGSGFGYYGGDINMDGKVSFTASNSDLNDLQLIVLLHPLNTTYSNSFDSLDEQLPQ